ncbi:WW domain-binding protein 4 [Condylostylus longicornis]|uniref:WW domain-binding protein 4 n=1 Tax=Condylostylus longicornis TaxID=2530218 RepID=UPI00244DFE84|nr:WW domain-binding protein 4 [Condylostylus longicornis]
MTEYWKSNERKYCDYCKCWITDNKASVSFHENGKRHKAAIANRISEISRKTAKEEKEKNKVDHELRKMEEAALKAYATDISNKADITGQTLQNLTSSYKESPASTSTNVRQPIGQVDPLRLPDDLVYDERDPKVLKKAIIEPPENQSLWVEGKSEKGFTYYWNVKTYKSVWEAPKEGYMKLEEYERLNEIAKKQQENQYALEAKNFRENVDEEVARYNREKMKKFRKNDGEEKRKEIEEKRTNYVTQEEASTSKIGSWQVVEEKKPELYVDLELPKVEQKWIPPVFSKDSFEPPAEKRFKEKTIGSLEPSLTVGLPVSFNKRKIPKGSVRKRQNDD